MTHHKRDYVAAMRARGYRVTAQRLAILDAICEIGRHATIGEIWQRVRATHPAIDQSTLYRALEFLCEIDLVVSAEVGNEGKVYEIAGETPHHHLVCKVCGSTQQIEHADVADLYRRIEQDYQFQIQTDHLMLSGICKRCRGRSQC